MGAIAIPTFETERLILRELRDGDLEAYAPMMADPEVTRYLGDGRTQARDEAWRSLAMLLGHWHLRGFGMWAVTARASDLMIGRVGFFQPEGWPGFEIGWTFARGAWGNGYATEAARRVLAHGFGEMGRKEIISVIHPDNAASIRVAEKIGERFARREMVRGIERLIYSVCAT
jgi:RimJ/RimL family protein N-acetyltransferase